jgi:hypothetical protein
VFEGGFGLGERAVEPELHGRLHLLAGLLGTRVGPRFRMRLVEQGTLDAARADAIAEEARQEMEAAVQFGLDSPFPEPEAALKHAYA